MKRKIFSCVLVSVLILSIFSGLNLSSLTASAAQIYKSGDYEYMVTVRNEILLTTYRGNDREVNIPSHIDGKPVIQISNYCFNGDERLIAPGEGFENHPNEWNNNWIRKVVIPSTVTTIGEYSFANMKRLNEVVFSEGLKTIKQFAFLNCPKLEKINLPDSLVDFTLLAFEETEIEEITLGANVKYLQLKEVHGSKVKRIISNASTIDISQISLGKDSVLEELICNNNLIISSRIKADNLKRIVCKGDASHGTVLMAISSGFRFDCDVYGNNIVFTKEIVNEPQYFESDGYLYYVNENNEAVIKRYIGGESNIVIPSTLDGHKVIAIAPLSFSCNKSGGAFADDGYITENQILSVFLPDTIEIIGKYAFTNNLSLEEINIPSGIKKIPAECFYNCESLKNVVLPDSVETIGLSSFKWCDKLESIEMYGVKKIEDYAFEDCITLSDIRYSEKLKSVGNGAFMMCKISGTLNLSSVAQIGSNAFDGTQITKVILNDNLEKLEYGVFQSCKNLEEINFPSRLVTIGESCFRGSGLNKAIFNEGLKEIGALAFDSCKELYIMELPESIEKIGSFAFENTLLEIVVIPENLKVIGFGAFGYCKELDILYFNAKNCVVEFDSWNIYEPGESDIAPPFIGCKLREIYLGEGVTSIGGYYSPYGTFENCDGLKSIIIPDSVSEIGAGAFKNCSSLETAVVSDSVTSIAPDAFEGCFNLTILCFKGSYVYNYAQTNGIKVSTFIIAPIPNQTYTGFEIKPEISVTYSGDSLYENVDFGVNYSDNINVGEANVIVRGKGDYKNFSSKAKFTIVTRSITFATVSPIPEYEYTGSAITPEVIVTDGSKILVADRDYIVSYSNNRREGTATVNISGIGNYSGKISAEFLIINNGNSQNFFSKLLYEIEIIFVKIAAFFSDLFSFL